MIFNIFLGLGSNLGDRKVNLETCKNLISSELGSCRLASQIYETPAWGIKEQPNFLNQVIAIQSSLYPFELMKKILQIELKMGRKRIVKWGERIIDIDILFIDTIILNSDLVKIPHPFIAERNFVLKPLAEIASDLIHPIYKKNITELTNETKDTSSCTIYRTN